MSTGTGNVMLRYVGLLQLAMIMPCVVSISTDTEAWMQPIRRLQRNEFMANCQRIFMSPGRMLRNEYLASQFASEVGDMCETYNMAEDCPPRRFTGLPPSLQEGFFTHACLHMGFGSRCPTSSLAMMGDTGYVYSSKTALELEAMRTDLCVQIGNSFGEFRMPDTPNDVSVNPPGTGFIPENDFTPENDYTQDTDFTANNPGFPTENIWPRPAPLPASPTSAPTTKVTISPTSTYQMDLSNGDPELITNNDNGGAAVENPNSNGMIPETQTGNDNNSNNNDAEALSVGAIIGIAVAACILLALFFYYENRRHRTLARQVAVLSDQSSAGGTSFKDKSTTVNVEKASTGFKSLPPPDSFRRKSSKQSSSKRLGIKPSTISPVEEIKEAIDNTDWDNVYRLASQLAQTDDVGSLPDYDGPIYRGHLNEENQERTKTLDELMAKGDWTGLAVTAALYAGESGSASPTTSRKSRAVQPSDAFDLSLSVVPSMGSLTTKMDHAINEGDWKKVQLLSLQAEKKKSKTTRSSQSIPDVPIRVNADALDIEKGEAPADMDAMVANLGAALKAGDWSQVSFYANKIKEEKGAFGNSSFGSGEIVDSKAMVVASNSSRPKVSLTQSMDSTDSDISRKLTIEKLMKANKWKGVSIMANLYEMESKQTNSVVKSTQNSPRGSRTSALRNDDRVGDVSNLVDFRRESDDKPEVPYL